MTATTFSIRSSRLRAAWTCCATCAPQDGQRPPGFRTREAPHSGQGIRCRIGTGRTVSDAVDQANLDGPRARPRSGSVGLLQVVAFLPAALLGTQDHHVAARLGLLLDGTQPAPEIFGLDGQYVADVLEGEDPRAVVALDPLLRVTKQLLAASVARPCQLAIDIDRVLEHRNHEAALALVLGPTSHAVEILR